MENPKKKENCIQPVKPSSDQPAVRVPAPPDRWVPPVSASRARALSFSVRTRWGRRVCATASPSVRALLSLRVGPTCQSCLCLDSRRVRGHCPMGVACQQLTPRPSRTAPPRGALAHVTRTHLSASLSSPTTPTRHGRPRSIKPSSPLPFPRAPTSAKHPALSSAPWSVPSPAGRRLLRHRRHQR